MRSLVEGLFRPGPLLLQIGLGVLVDVVAVGVV
jgi:hypothetical protein